jgi:hypothetical protein
MLMPTNTQQESETPTEQVEGFKYLKMLNGVLEKLHDVATERDRAGNRDLHFDQYVSLILLYFFSPTLTSLRAVQRASELVKVQKISGGKRVSLGSLSEAQSVFDPSLLRNILGDLASQAAPLSHGKEAEALKGLTAVDGSLLPALPRMAWALWQDDQHRAAKLHLHFDVFEAIPVEATLTEGNGSERHELRNTLQKGRLYVLDRGYLGYEFFQEIIDADASFICRVKENTVYRVTERRPISKQAAEAGVIEDVIVDWLGSDPHNNRLKQPVRIVKVLTQDVRKNGEPVVLVLVTDRLDLDADLVALGYRYRWSVELYFRWFKCILGCRHLLLNSPDGVAIQIYTALIASLLIRLRTGCKPNKATYEMFCHYFSGWATEAELNAFLERQTRRLENRKTGNEKNES